MNPDSIDKRALLDLLRDRLEAELRNLTTSQNAAQDGATHEETRQEDPKDTRAIEATYLARGLAERVESTRDAVALLSRLEVVAFGPDDAVGVTALVALENEGGGESIFFVVPAAAGETLTVNNGVAIRTLTPGSPLGRALIGREVDDEVELELPGRRRLSTIVWIR